MTDITELAQRNELLIANGQQTADLLRHLADNEIDSDYFAVVSECESYGKETEAELSITEFALRAAGYVDALVEALEKAQQRIVELDRKNCELDSLTQRWAVERAENADRIAELESRTVKLPTERFCPAEYAGSQLWSETEVWNKAITACADELRAAGIKVEAE
ncbi:Uncharacterised protein [Klebsiella pneumoniae]|uniref:hypothetical protein n=1 Tax=Klebsiella pneumoniae TaxID=573 RepID=UPI0007CBDC11|nr:hypothetical protein [Klebsiella pneumoniae]SAX26445.1 Uncharacterised protein [Klebsiella pneumoniae]